jgi:hypothetical protein
MMGMTKVRFISAVTVLLVLFAPLRGSAESYDVTAAVPFRVPDMAAVIDPSFQGMNTGSDVLEIFGTCQHVNPTSIVSIWRLGDLVGSVNCEANGTFRLNIGLSIGANSLIARSSNLEGSYGPDSGDVTVTYTLKTPGQPIPSGQSELELSSLTPYETLDESNGVTIQITVGGGQGPYTIVINWGDGSTETLLVDDPGTFSFKHVYVEPGIYKVVATVTDILGVSKVYQFIVASTSPPAPETEEQKVSAVEKSDNGFLKLLIHAGGLIAGLAVLFSSFSFGRRYQFKKLEPRLRELEEHSSTLKTRDK